MVSYTLSTYPTDPQPIQRCPASSGGEVPTGVMLERGGLPDGETKASRLAGKDLGGPMNDSTLGAAAALCRRAGGWTSESSLVSRRHPDPMPPCKRDLQYLWRQMRLQINCLP